MLSSFDRSMSKATVPELHSSCESRDHKEERVSSEGRWAVGWEQSCSEYHMLRLRGREGVLQYNNVFWDRSRVGLRKQYVPQKKERLLCQRNLGELQTVLF